MPGTPIHIHRLAKKIMMELDAFEGSRPLLDDVDVLIVRGMSRGEDWDLDNLQGYLESVLERCDVEVVDPESPEGKELIEELGKFVVERIQAQYADEEPVSVRPVENPMEAVDAFTQGEIFLDPLGFERLKRDLEALGCVAAYTFGRTPDDLGVFLAAWADRSGIGPKSVELLVANLKG
ncbi:DUF2120 family protein [Methanopyrus kandleri]|uniref:DUF2120 family protein n=1 Tax=Methanopyrus kandleri TaxID=2320 RepID=UPI001305184D|nr:DUF2120 family protein [Methanopyrus kandleri]